MIIFDRLQVSDAGDMLYIDAHVNQASYFNNIYIDYIVIKTASQVSEADPLSADDNYVYMKTVSGSQKEIHLALQAAELNENFISANLSSDLFFVYVVCKGTADECTPCRLDEMTTLGVTFDYSLLYQKAMGYTRELADNCEIPQNFIDFILSFNAFKFAVDTEHYIPAIKFYNQMLGISDGVFSINNTITKGCGCHG